MNPNCIFIGDPRSLGTSTSTLLSAAEMSRLSRALKRLGGKPKQTKDETATAQPLQSDPKPSLGAHMKTSPAQPPAQGSPRLNSASNVTTSTLQKPASLSREAQQAPPPCYPALQSRKAVPSARKEAALQPKLQPAQIGSPKKTPQSGPQRELPNAKEVKGQSVAPKAPGKIAQQPSYLGKAPAVNPQPQPAPKPIVTALKAKPQPPPKATRQTPKPTSKFISTPKPRPTLKATQQTPKPTSQWVSTPKPAVQTHAGLYSGFTPRVAAVDKPHPKTLSEAQKVAFDVLYEASPSDTGVPKTRRQYTRPEDIAPAALPGPPTMSSRPNYPASFPIVSYSSAGSLGTFCTGGPLGGGEFSSTGGAIGGGAIPQTGGRFGEGSVSKTGGSLGEGLGLQDYESSDEPEKSTNVFGANASLGWGRLRAAGLPGQRRT